MTTLQHDNLQGAKKPLKPGHPCYCTKPGHVWHNQPSDGTWCGQPVYRELASGNIARTCQQCFEANERFRAQRAAQQDEERALELALENERRWAQGKPPIAPEHDEVAPPPPITGLPEARPRAELSPQKSYTVRRTPSETRPNYRTDIPSDGDEDISRAKF